MTAFGLSSPYVALTFKPPQSAFEPALLTDWCQLELRRSRVLPRTTFRSRSCHLRCVFAFSRSFVLLNRELQSPDAIHTILNFCMDNVDHSDIFGSIRSLVRCGAKNRTVLNFPYRTMLLWYDTTSVLGRERAYLRRIWPAQYLEVLHVTATKFPIYRATQKRGAPLTTALGASAARADQLFRLLNYSKNIYFCANLRAELYRYYVPIMHYSVHNSVR